MICNMKSVINDAENRDCSTYTKNDNFRQKTTRKQPENFSHML